MLQWHKNQPENPGISSSYPDGGQTTKMSAAAATYKMGQHGMELGGRYLGELRDSTDVLHDVAALKRRLDEHGYLLLRGLQKRENVAAARRTLLENLAANQQIDTSRPLDEGVMAAGGRGAFLGGQNEVARHPSFISLVESPEIMGFFDRMFGKTSLTFGYKWVRAVNSGGFTGAHYDIVYMGRGSVRNLHTCWTPLGDMPVEQGPLVVLEGSHNLESFRKLRETYGKMDVDRDNIAEGWISNNPYEMVDQFGGQWKTADFRMGDVMIFGMYTLHGSLVNKTNRYRLSCDTRYQPHDEPVDERWRGKAPIGHYAWNKTTPLPMEEARKKWGV
jgi:ectoine hydroxylase-related dioxygenase (phytanoyl-CoA dioxygenase family)